ncbi:uncharacterized protein LOC126907709 isoform X2 [Daktulosphaira vitifoliae]|uniref:uncharacterized protein LOC126907709 isoform X2 n=1 Tax=Daktulosphaira vitifoliae TaxID=58002 RepID=UPI0021A9DD2A|nr:uncharacterized protein LOC126907709 isoform X2 [Daktulosphaira vitifoliae]
MQMKELTDNNDSEKSVSIHNNLKYCTSSYSDSTEIKEVSLITLDGAELNDFPAKYSVPLLKSYELAAVGVWIHPNIVPGFKYKVRPIDNDKERTRFLFDNRALELLSIGRGYSRRLTFEASPGLLNENDNYFWTDSMPSGYAFQVYVVSVGDNFTVYDANNVAVATLEVTKVQGAQKEITHEISEKGEVIKQVEVNMLCKVEWFYKEESFVTTPVTGIAIASKSSRESAKLVNIFDASIGLIPCRGYTLIPGVDNKQRQLVLNGCSIGDVPTVYTITGLEPYELPVIGTYIDSRITPGFNYKVRPAGHKHHLFNGNALQLVNIGMGYGKRITFKPDKNNLNNNTNYFWSDSYPDGYGFEPQAVFCGMKFDIMDGTLKIGQATVFRSDNPQIEDQQSIVKGKLGSTITKYIHIDVTCHVVLKGNEVVEESHDLGVSGTAVVVKYPKQNESQLLYVDNIGLSSKLNIVFMNQESHLIFQPI